MTRESALMKSWTAVTIVLACCFPIRTSGSAIPMWEFLTKTEKINHLYNIFARQAAIYCHDSTLPDCNKLMLIVGARNLANMDENELDRMDPYQRNADDIIWSVIIGKSKLPVKYDHSNSYYTAENDVLATSESDQNGLGEESSRIDDYVKPTDHTGPYLAGPMVIRVLPDGRPVPEDAARPLPRDEDIEDMKLTIAPSVTKIKANRQRFPQRPVARSPYRYFYSMLYENRHAPDMSFNARILRFY